MVAHILNTTANYLRVLAILVSISYAPALLMPQLLRYVFTIESKISSRIYKNKEKNEQVCAHLL
jgi:hypothetical protein